MEPWNRTQIRKGGDQVTCRGRRGRGIRAAREGGTRARGGRARARGRGIRTRGGAAMARDG